MLNDQQNQNIQPDIIHSGLTHFPTYRQIFTIIILLIFQLQGIYISLPLNINSNMSFLIGQLFLLVVIIYAWYMTLCATPGPMSQLFNQEFIKKTIQQGLKQQHSSDQQKICTKCQIQRALKLYHCEKCNRCVYKNYFHSKWLSTCISKQNFSSFIAFLVFLQIYLILMGIDNIVHFMQLKNPYFSSLVDFFSDDIQNAIVISFLIVISVFILMIISMIAISCFMIFKTKISIEPLNCLNNCEGLKKKSQNDKILHKIRQSIRQSNLVNHFQKQSSQGSRDDLFRQTQNLSTQQLNLRALKKSMIYESRNISKQKQRQRQSICSIEGYQGPIFKTDFFSSAKIFRKRQNSIQRKNRLSRMNSLSDQDMVNMTTDKWKKYIKNSFRKQYYPKRNSQLDQIIQRKPNQQFQSPMQFIYNRELLQNQRESTFKNNQGTKNRKISKFFQQNNLSQDKQNQNGFIHPKKIRFIKKFSSNLASIFQKDSKLQDA